MIPYTNVNLDFDATKDIHIDDNENVVNVVESIDENVSDN